VQNISCVFNASVDDNPVGIHVAVKYLSTAVMKIAWWSVQPIQSINQSTFI